MLETILGIAVALFAGLNIFQFIFFKSTQRKYKADADKAQAAAKSDEIENIKKAVESVYQPLIDRQNKLIEQQSQKIDNLNDKVEKLTDENRSLRDELSEVNRALAAKADVQPRAANGTFTKRK